MSAFADGMNKHIQLAKSRLSDVFVGTTVEVKRSVVEGSEITGAPGSPVDTGNLKGSWIGEFDSATSWQLSTNVDYAKHVEDNVRGVTFKVGGAHSVAKTVGGFDKIVAHVNAEAKRA